MTRSFNPEDLSPPEEFVRLVETLEEAGYQAWAVGGALRDAVDRRLTGRRPLVRPEGDLADWDVATDALPEEVIHLFPRTVPLGVEHGTVGVLQPDGVVYEVTTFRRDIETDGRHAEVSFAETIDEDLARRDFTINAMAWRAATGQFTDPFDGRADLDAGTLRAVGEPEERFAEDYLRVLRGIRFAGRFDLELDPPTRDALFEAARRVDHLSAERVREELVKVLRDRVPSSALDLYAETAVLDTWLPELRRLTGDRADWRAHLGTVDEIKPHRPLVRLARLLSALSDDADERHALSLELLTRLRFSNADRKRVSRLVSWASPFVSPLDGSARHRFWLSEVGDAWRDLFRMHVGAARRADDPRASHLLVATWRSIHDEVLEHPPLGLGDLSVDGNDMAELGLGAGPMIGLLLDELLAQVIEEPERNDREVLLAEASRLIEIGALAGPAAEGAEPSDG